MDRPPVAHPELDRLSAAVTGAAVPVARGVVLTGAGGALGALLRWWLGVLVPVDGGFPWTTLGINISGSALLAALPLLPLVRRRPWLPLLLGTGFLGGFTTMSTFSVEVLALAESSQPALAAGYVLATLLGAVTAVALVERLASVEGRDEVERLEGDE